MAQVTTDHNTIGKWAEKKHGKPAAVKRTHQGGDVGIVRIMVPDRPQSEHEDLSKTVGRDTVKGREHGDRRAAR